MCTEHRYLCGCSSCKARTKRRKQMRTCSKEGAQYEGKMPLQYLTQQCTLIYSTSTGLTDASCTGTLYMQPSKHVQPAAAHSVSAMLTHDKSHQGHFEYFCTAVLSIESADPKPCKSCTNATMTTNEHQHGLCLFSDNQSAGRDTPSLVTCPASAMQRSLLLKPREQVN